MVKTHLFSPPDPPHHPALLAKASQPGRIRGTALEIYRTLLESPLKADTILSQSLRKARHLHSRERRFVADSLYALLRYHSLLNHILGRDNLDDFWDLWLQWQGNASDITVDIEQSVRDILATQSPVDALSIIGGFDPDISEALIDSLGESVWPFLWASNSRAPVTLRTNPARASRKQVHSTLRKKQIETEFIQGTSFGLKVCGPANLQGEKCFQDGWFEIQDEGSQHLAALCGTVTGTVIDYCAGAGGKTLAISAQSPKAKLICCDVRTSALKQLEKRALRARVPALRIHTLEPEKPLKGMAETVFVDAPCSGLGTLRRHPELRLRLNENSLQTVTKLQRQILDTASTHVLPGGRLIYGTCSVLRAENEDIVSAFLADHTAFTADPKTALHMAPHTHNTDGFYGIVLHKTA